MVRMAFVRRTVIMAMVTVDDVGGHKLVQDSRNGLDANEACRKEGHHDKASRLVGPTLLLEILFGLGQHAEERGEELEAERKRQRSDICTA